ncbi:hypothetical protein E4665_07790 [Sporolactobacillus shoreae]|uniref:Uncharacterized protein n=1 Tax=Sporolactobacillus shoreae TaxID=1465501 RepID=A0A4Z0GMU6_9BACL|nr:hypothetical protein [Sporolactobacillus shoreae]TGA98422.1 hypothetical protein E4665_07790 [Sporolactobacillus shoreae]
MKRSYRLLIAIGLLIIMSTIVIFTTNNERVSGILLSIIAAVCILIANKDTNEAILKIIKRNNKPPK